MKCILTFCHVYHKHLHNLRNLFDYNYFWTKQHFLNCILVGDHYNNLYTDKHTAACWGIHTAHSGPSLCTLLLHLTLVPLTLCFQGVINPTHNFIHAATTTAVSYIRNAGSNKSLYSKNSFKLNKHTVPREESGFSYCQQSTVTVTGIRNNTDKTVNLIMCKKDKRQQ